MAEKKKAIKKPSTMLEAPKIGRFKILANKVFIVIDRLKAEDANKNFLKDKLISLTTTIREKEMTKRFIKSVKVFGSKERYLLMEYKNSFFKYDISEIKALKEIFAGYYKKLFSEVRDEVSFNKTITKKELKEFFKNDEKKLKEFEEKFVNSYNSYVKPNNKFQEIAYELDKEFTKKQRDRAKIIYEDATHSVTMKVDP